MEVILNFGGFYETEHGGLIDTIIEDSSLTDCNGNLAPDFYEKSEIDYTTAKKDYCKHFCNFVGEMLDIKLKFNELVSPKEYNFMTDRIFATITKKDVAKVIKYTKENYTEELEAVILEAATEKSGYIPFYTAKELRADKELLLQCCLDVLFEQELTENEWRCYFDNHYLYELGCRNKYVEYNGDYELDSEQAYFVKKGVPK